MYVSSRHACARRGSSPQTCPPIIMVETGGVLLCVLVLQCCCRSCSHQPLAHTDYYTIRRFVRARQHDLERAHTMLVNHIAWRKETGADNILDSFAFAERDSFLTIYPQGYHKTDKMVRVGV